MLLLIDECCGKSLVSIANRFGHTAHRTVDVVGRQASDAEIFAFALMAEAVIVTVNQGDFINLATRSFGHGGIILLPSVPIQPMRQLFSEALAQSPSLFSRTNNLIIKINGAGLITSLKRP